jgi:pyridoxamine 5'-phosphate oxidase
MSRVSDKIRTLRYELSFVGLSEKNMDKNPFRQFELWMNDAILTSADESNAMTLATVGKKGFPDARIVLLRGIDKRSFSFFTNYNSKKGKDIAANNKACLNFFWTELGRQVRIKGTIKKLPAKESDKYFNSRPRESQLGAWSSEQSAIIEGRNILEAQFEFYKNKFEGKKVPRPPYWGGYLLIPAELEFWQGRENRMHDRIVYLKLSTGKWKMERLSP